MSVDHRTLVLLRHAKSAYPAGIADHDRPLAARGVREAGLAGTWLRANLPGIDAVLCSTATRTRQTLTHTGVDAPVRYTERLYDATPAAVLDEITATADAVLTLLVVGHEPALSQLALGLADDANPVDAGRISVKFPTSAIAVLRVPNGWRRLEPGAAALVGFQVPR